MPVFLIVIGVLLALFGGGCTVLFFGMEAPSDFLALWLGLGLAPLAGGILLIRQGIRLQGSRRGNP
jgi:hypothetical protein